MTGASPAPLPLPPPLPPTPASAMVATKIREIAGAAMGAQSPSQRKSSQQQEPGASLPEDRAPLTASPVVRPVPPPSGVMSPLGVPMGGPPELRLGRPAGGGADRTRRQPEQQRRDPFAPVPVPAPAPAPDADDAVGYLAAAMKYASGAYQGLTSETTSQITSLLSTFYTPSSNSHLSALDGGRQNSHSHPLAGDLSPLSAGGGSEAPPAAAPSALRSPARKGPPIELRWLMKNPYNSVRGLHASPSSVSAVRSLLTLVPVADGVADGVGGGLPPPPPHLPLRPIDQPKLVDVDAVGTPDDWAGGDGPSSAAGASSPESSLPAVPSVSPVRAVHGLAASESMLSVGGIDSAAAAAAGGRARRPVSDAETASRLAEGTLRALRDIALEEAVELHSALHFWTERWERPVLSWLESGPSVWLSGDGYNHQVVGRKVSQIQAVLARRCASIGQLQEHLLRAGWQRGVQQWGVLGQGGQWATVAGGDGKMDAPLGWGGVGGRDGASTPPSLGSGGVDRRASGIEIFPAPPGQHRRRTSSYYGEADAFVNIAPNGHIERDDAALTAWTVDAVRVVRDQLYKAGIPNTELPFFEHWRDEVTYFSPREADNEPCKTPIRFTSAAESLPLWATDDVDVGTQNCPSPVPAGGGSKRRLPIRSDGRERIGIDELGANDEAPLMVESPLYLELPDGKDGGGGGGSERGIRAMSGDIRICDLALFAKEISALLDSMEVQMAHQRRRRLLKLKPPTIMKRNWYVASVVTPVVGCVAFKLFHDGLVKDLVKSIGETLKTFYVEHLSGPLRSIIGEIFKGRPDITDRKARLEAIETLRSMLGSWLDDTFPDMANDEKIDLANEMNISLVEKAKEEAIKRSVFEINSIVRLSMIEMQFIKKELMSALVSMDELMSSNEINMKVAAMTPAFLLLYGVRQIFRFAFYAIVKARKSREETFASFRHIILDIERLLVMRANPPSAPPPLSGSSMPLTLLARELSGSAESSDGDVCVLSAEDLGMLMLLIHECRKILWEDHRRFSRNEIRNLTEDLAELSGERGPVSVQQQLMIVKRMVRTYSFLKVISTGHSFEFFLGRGMVGRG